MIREFSIKNYKSVVDLKLELGRINLFIGENGCGKTNILEAMAMAAAAITDRLDNEELYNRGVRIAKPEITLSSFTGLKPPQALSFEFKGGLADDEIQRHARLSLFPSNGSAIASFSRVDPKQGAPAELTKMLSPRAIELLKSLSDGHDSSDPALANELIAFYEKFADSTSAERRKNFIQLNLFAIQLGDFLIYNANHLALRGLLNLSRKEPLGIHGENLDVTIASLGDKGIRELLERSALIRWVERIFTDPDDKLKFEGYKLGRSTSTLYFRDRFMRKRENLFSAENANEGILHALFYLTLFISDRTPKTFGIDNIETALNPRLCRDLIKQLGSLSKAHDKQALITTHNPAALDGLDLHDDEQRLFVVSRDDKGRTVANRIKLKPETKGKEPRLMLSEMWMRGQLGGIPLEF